MQSRFVVMDATCPMIALVQHAVIPAMLSSNLIPERWASDTRCEVANSETDLAEG